MCAMELRSVREFSSDQAIEADQPSHGASPANDARQPHGDTPQDGHACGGQAIGRAADRTAATTPAVPEGEPAIVPGDPQALLARSPVRVDLARQRLAERLERMENPVTGRTDLRERLNNLEPGHPSSPCKEDGTPRPPTPRSADLERLDPPLSDAAYAAHVREVSKRLDDARAAGLRTEKLFTLDPNHRKWTLERTHIHKSILDEKWQETAEVPCERRAIIAGGLGGSGKTTVLKEHVQVDQARYLTVDPDAFKKELADRGLVPDVPGLSPMEASSLAHEESSYLARQLAARALREGKNLIWDITMSSPSSAGMRVDELRAADYNRIDGVFVEIPIETSIARTEARHRRGCDLYLAGQGKGGRYVPPEIIRAQTDTEFGSVNRRSFEELKGRFDHWAIYDNSIEGRAPILIDCDNWAAVPCSP
jgi:predicted kinase